MFTKINRDSLQILEENNDLVRDNTGGTRIYASNYLDTFGTIHGGEMLLQMINGSSCKNDIKSNRN